MTGVTKYFPDGETEVRAFEAGNDILLMLQDIPLAISKIKNAIDDGKIPMSMLEVSVKKILAAKFDMGLAKWHDIDPVNIVNDLNEYVDPIRKAVSKNAITLSAGR